MTETASVGSRREATTKPNCESVLEYKPVILYGYRYSAYSVLKSLAQITAVVVLNELISCFSVVLLEFVLYVIFHVVLIEVRLICFNLEYTVDRNR